MAEDPEATVRRPKLVIMGRKITRRLSLMSKVPSLLQNKLTSKTSTPENIFVMPRPKLVKPRKKIRVVSVTVVLPDLQTRKITGFSDQTVSQLIAPLTCELHFCDFKLRLGDSLALVDLKLEAGLLDGDTVILEDAHRVRDERGETDSRFRASEDFLFSEREYTVTIKGVEDLYGRPLRKLSSINEDEHRLIFGVVEPICSISNTLISKLEDALGKWDPAETRIGSLFSKQFWAQYEIFLDSYLQAKELLREKQCCDEEFVEFCKLRRGAALHTLDCLLALPLWKSTGKIDAAHKEHAVSPEGRPSRLRGRVSSDSDMDMRLGDRTSVMPIPSYLDTLQRKQQKNGQVLSGKATWGGWRSWRKTSDSIMDYASLYTPGVTNVLQQQPQSITMSPDAGEQLARGTYRAQNDALGEASVAVVRKINASKNLFRKLEGSKTLGHRDAKEVQRLASYERYFQELLSETQADHPDVDDLTKAHSKAQQLVSRADREVSELDRIQDLFPNDPLYLHDKDAGTLKMKGLIRKRSTTAARLQRAFSAKALRSPSSERTSSTSSSGGEEGTHGSPSRTPSTTPVSKPSAKRQFVMETAVQFTTGVQSQERHLFLFNDLLLVAKARSGGNFKLKEKVRVAEMWLAECIDDVTEATKAKDVSFVMGWPTCNVVATFSSTALRDLWWSRLHQSLQSEREAEPKSTTIQIVFHDALQNIEYVKTLCVAPHDNARDCVRLALSHLEMGDLDATGFQLWVKSDSDEAPYPLIGHEFPFAIKMNCLRDCVNAEEGFDLDHCNNLYSTDHTLTSKCQFILRKIQKPSFNSPDKKKKNKKSPSKIQKVFRRVNSKGDALDASDAAHLFGQPLTKICDGDALPKPIMAMLWHLFQKGPFTVGIFRKSANARQVRELREQVEAGELVDWEAVNAVVLAVLLKDFLRSLPDCLLTSQLYAQWLEAVGDNEAGPALNKIRSLCDKLPAAHLTLLRHFLCVLHRIAQHCSQNMMSASNLAVCVGPSLLWSNTSPSAAVNPALALSAEATASKQLPALVTCLIERCDALFGPDTSKLFGEPLEEQTPTLVNKADHESRFRHLPPVYRHMARNQMNTHDSGAEESDSLHSLHSGHSRSDALRRDDSSVDSLERELLHDAELHEASNLPRRDKMSVTNLSRDSGLTLSDTQLYTPDEEEGSESSSSGHSGRKSVHSGTSSGRGSDKRLEPYNYVYDHPKLIPSYSAATAPAEYHRVYQTREQPSLDVYRKLSDDAVYAVPNPKSSPMACFNDSDLQSEENASSNFQRKDWFRRKSHLRKIGKSNSKEEDSPTGTPLRRSASEESLANTFKTPSLSANSQAKRNAESEGHASKKPALHRKGRAPLPPPTQNTSPTLVRSKSVMYLADDKDESSSASCADNAIDRNDWSKSTPHIDHVERSYDSSTLSDDDSTPHVSRSNSRGKDYGAVNSAWESAYGALSVPVPAPLSFLTPFRHTSEDISSRSSSSSATTVRNPNRNDEWEPPTYEETLHRRSHSHSNSQRSSSDSRNTKALSGPEYLDSVVQEQMVLSARAKKLYEESLKQYRQKETDEYVHVRASPVRVNSQEWEEEIYHPNLAPAVPPKADAPPLPPKQKIGRKSFPSTPSSEGPKLRQHPRVEERTHLFPRTRPVTIHMDSLYPRAENNQKHQAPSLPPKERSKAQRNSHSIYGVVRHSDRPRGTNVSVVNIEPIYAPLHRSQVPMRHETPEKSEKYYHSLSAKYGGALDVVRDQEIQTSGTWMNSSDRETNMRYVETETQTSLTPEPVEDEKSFYTSDRLSSVSGPSERRSRAKQRERESVKRSASLPPPLNSDEEDSDDDEAAEDSLTDSEYEPSPRSKSQNDSAPSASSGARHYEYGYSNHQQKQQTSRSRSAVQNGNVTPKSSQRMSLSKRPEISWSVSQLRALFTDTQQQAADTVASSIPPPYRYPPTMRNNRAPITTYYLGQNKTDYPGSTASKATYKNRRRSDSADSCGEESYV